MDCALWLNRHKIRTAAEIAEAPDIASLRGYFIAGSLVGWLREHGGEKLAEKLETLSPDAPDLNEKLAEIFGGSAEGHKRFGEGVPETSGGASENLSSAFTCSLKAVLSSFEFGSSGSYGYSEITSFGSLLHGWELFLGSFLYGSYTFGSGMHEWEWEQFFALYKSGSFTFGSFASFHEWEWEWLFRAFRSESFGGSFGSFGSFGFGSFWRFGNFGGSMGSLSIPFPESFDLLDEYDRIMLETLMRCPLDRFGYGIHNI